MYQAALEIPRSAVLVFVGERQYAAGLFDGEGCVVIERQNRKNTTRKQYQVGITVLMTDRAALEFLSSRWGGRVYNRPIDRRSPNNRPTYHWRIQSLAAERFLADIEPFSIVKKPQISLARKFRAECIRPTRHGMTIRSPYDSTRAEWYREEMKRLKREVVL